MKIFQVFTVAADTLLAYTTLTSLRRCTIRIRCASPPALVFYTTATIHTSHSRIKAYIFLIWIYLSSWGTRAPVAICVCLTVARICISWAAPASSRKRTTESFCCADKCRTISINGTCFVRFLATLSQITSIRRTISVYGTVKVRLLATSSSYTKLQRTIGVDNTVLGCFCWLAQDY